MKLIWKQPRGLGAEIKSLDADVAFRQVRCHDQETEPIGATLKSPVISLAAYHVGKLPHFGLIFLRAQAIVSGL